MATGPSLNGEGAYAGWHRISNSLPPVVFADAVTGFKMYLEKESNLLVQARQLCKTSHPSHPSLSMLVEQKGCPLISFFLTNVGNGTNNDLLTTAVIVGLSPWFIPG
jgi:hypothetical protein